MAGRPPKGGIDYSGWDVGIFDNDPKIDKLMEAQGCAGFVIYFFLCQRAYGSSGYFYPWTYDDAATTAKKIGGGVGSESVINTVNLCLRIGLLDNDLYVRWKIITSRGIQKRYAAVASTRTHKSVISEYWLLNEEESGGLVKVAHFEDEKTNLPGHNSIMTPHNSIMTPHNSPKVKESKDILLSQHSDGVDDERASEKKKRKANEPFPHDHNAYLAADYMAKKILKHTPKASYLFAGDKREPTIQRWAADIDKMFRLDKVPFEEFKAVLEFSQTDPFWRSNILSGKKLRENYLQLAAKLQAQEAET